MGKVTHAAPHLSLHEVKEQWRASVDFWLHQKWLVIYHALVDPRPAATIARHLGVSVPFVHKMISLYNRSGPAALDTPGRGGRRRQYLTRAEEPRFLTPVLPRAASGEMATIRAIQTAFEAQVQHRVHNTPISRMVKRHGWRQIVPRPQHPAATAHTQEALKKTLRQPSKPLFKPARPLSSAQSSKWLKMRAGSAASARPPAVGPRRECDPRRHARSCARTSMPIQP